MNKLVVCVGFLIQFTRLTVSVTKQSTSSTTMTFIQPPNNVQLEFTARGQLVKFNLTRSMTVNGVRSNDNPPLLIGERGRILWWNVSNSSQNHYAVYEDALNKASFVRVHCHEKARHIYMGSFSLNSTMYAMKPLARNGLSQTPYTDKFIEVIIDSVMYRIVPIDTLLDFSDVVMHTALSTTTSSPKRRQAARPYYTRRSRLRACLHLSRHHKQRIKRCKLFKHKNKLRSKNSSKSTSKHFRRGSKRSKRQAVQQNYIVNMLVVVDYAIYYRWYIESMAKTVQAKRADAMQNIMYYYSNIINGINMRYSSISQPDFSLSVRFAGIYAATTPTDSPFTEGPDVKIGVSYTDPYKALVKFGTFVVDTLQSVIPFDQATLFTGNKLIIYYSDGSNGTISGLANIEGICRGNLSVTVNYEGGEYSSTQTASHELGHNLGAQHDGAGNTCSSDDQYMMATGPQYLTDRNFDHPFKFSACTVNYFRKHLNINTANCLLDRPSSTTVTTPSVYPGQRFNADRQCQIIYGSQSFYCAGGSRDRSICREMKCWVPAYNDCFAGLEQRAFEGTTCGNQMLCLWGNCVTNEYASTAADNCIYGDYKGYFSLSDTVKMNCSMIGANEPWRCYDRAYSLDCCQTCSVIRNNAAPGCEYGDNDWSGSCSTIQRQDCYEDSVRRRCCVTCQKMTNQLAPLGCEFGNKASWCNQTNFSAYQCYTQALSTCCETCLQYFTPDTGCEYGDHVDWCQTYSELNCNDPALASQCCSTCTRKSLTTKQRTTASAIAIRKLLAPAVTLSEVTRGTRLTKAPVSTKTVAPAFKIFPVTRRPTLTKLPIRTVTLAPTFKIYPVTRRSTLIKLPSSTRTMRTTFKSPTSTRTALKEVPIWTMRPTVKLTTSTRRTTLTKGLISTTTMPPTVKLTSLQRGAMLTATTIATDPVSTTQTMMKMITYSTTSSTRKAKAVAPSTREKTLQTTTVVPVVPNRSCPLGDGASFCSTLLVEECYNYEHLCCETCPKYFLNTPGCEYGDMVGWCATYVQSLDECKRPEVAIYCCQTCANIEKQNAVSVCTDKAEWCYGMFPGYCYDSSVESTCCATCSEMKTTSSDCQYGDRFTWCEQQFCSQNALECCASCIL